MQIKKKAKLSRIFYNLLKKKLLKETNKYSIYCRKSNINFLREESDYEELVEEFILKCITKRHKKNSLKCRNDNKYYSKEK